MNIPHSLTSGIKTLWYMLLTLPFIWMCVLLNLAGMLLCIAVGSPILFFDMTGTAVASLSRGLGYGVVVGLASNLTGALFLPHLAGFDPQVYMWFGFTNAIGAVVWAVAPRWIVGYQEKSATTFKDFFSTNPAVGYRTLLFQIASVGLIAGVVVGLAGILTQALALGCTQQNDMELCVQANPAVRSGYIISTYFHSGGALDSFLPPLALIIFDIVDKTIATASAMMLIFIFCDVPNYNIQRAKLASYVSNRATEPQSFYIARMAYILSLLVFAILYGRVLFAGANALQPGRMAVFAASLGLLALFLLRALGVPLHNIFYGRNSDNAKIHHDKSLIGSQSVHRDVFEDILKTIVIVVTIFNLGLERLQNQLEKADQLQRNVSGTNVSLEIFPTERGAGGLAGHLLISLAAPIVFLNLWRYFIVFMARFWGVVYRDASEPLVRPWLRPWLWWLSRAAGILFLLMLIVRAL